MKLETIVVFGATGQTGRHFTEQALDAGHRVTAVVRTPANLRIEHERLSVLQGSIIEKIDFKVALQGADAVVAMLGEAKAQARRTVNADFVRRLVFAMRQHGVVRFLYQAGGLSVPPGQTGLVLRTLQHTIARSFLGQHRDNEAVMSYLTHEAEDIQWVVHRAGIDPRRTGSFGELERSSGRPSLASFADCAAYNLTAVLDDRAAHTTDTSRYRR